MLIKYTVGSGKYTKSVDAHDLDDSRPHRATAHACKHAHECAAHRADVPRLPSGAQGRNARAPAFPVPAPATRCTRCGARPRPSPICGCVPCCCSPLSKRSGACRCLRSICANPLFAGQPVSRRGTITSARRLRRFPPGISLMARSTVLPEPSAAQRNHSGGTAITTQSATAATLPDDSIDYIFTDPPFGENIYYADLNYLVESWHGVRTDSGPEAIIDQAKHKTLADYQELMHACFRRYYAALKPGRWITRWISTTATTRSGARCRKRCMSVGFVVANTRTLDKQQASYRQVPAASAAKQDLVISAYKPASGFQQRFLSHAGTEEAAWDSTRTPCTRTDRGLGQERPDRNRRRRQNYLLFDRMVAYHIQRGAVVPLGTATFYAGLADRFAERDGMYFLPEQTAEYDRARLAAAGMAQLALFVSDEKSAFAWLGRNFWISRVASRTCSRAFAGVAPGAHEALPDLRCCWRKTSCRTRPAAGTCPTPTRPRTWRSSACAACCASSRATSRAAAACASSAPRRSGLRSCLARARLRHHRQGRRAVAGGCVAGRPGFVDVLRSREFAGPPVTWPLVGAMTASLTGTRPYATGVMNGQSPKPGPLWAFVGSVTGIKPHAATRGWASRRAQGPTLQA